MSPWWFKGAERVLDHARFEIEGDGSDCVPIHDGGALKTSVWKPDPHELAVLMRGGGVTLTVVCGRRHPVVALGVAEPETLLVSA